MKITIEKLNNGKLELKSTGEKIETLGAIVGGYVLIAKAIDLNNKEMHELLDDAIKNREGK